MYSATDGFLAIRRAVISMAGPLSYHRRRASESRLLITTELQHALKEACGYKDHAVAMEACDVRPGPVRNGVA